MTTMMKTLLAGLFSGLVAFTGTLTGALMELPQGAALADVGGVTWLIASLFGLGAAAKDWRTFLMPQAGELPK